MNGRGRLGRQQDRLCGPGPTVRASTLVSRGQSGRVEGAAVVLVRRLATLLHT